MKKILLIVIFLLVPLSTLHAQEPGAPGLDDSLYPEFGNGGYDVQHYAIEMQVDPATGEITSTVTIDAIATQDLSSFNLDFIGLEINSIWVGETEVEYERNGQELTLYAELAADEAFQITLDYSGAPEEMTSVALPVLTGWIAMDDGSSFVISEPDGAANFFPSNDHPLDKATYEFWLTVPDPYEAIANGVLQEVELNEDGTRTFHWVHDYPMASYLTTINIGDYELQEEVAPTGLPIRNYFAVGIDPALREAFARQGEMIAYYSDLFGEYPFDVYGAIVVNVETGTALETQTLSIFGTDSADELTVAHELVHQWFGDSVSVADWSDIWLNEGIAMYGEGLWVEHLEGPEALDNWVTGMYQYVDESITNEEGIVPPGNPPADDLFNDGVYVWGALTFHALRLTVGDEAFFEILQTYLERYQYGNVTTDDFIAVAEEISGLDLTDFFEMWLYSESLPELPSE